MLTLDVGCGENKRGDIGTDVRSTPCVDVVSSTYHLPFKAETFDSVHLLEVLEHLENPSNALREINRVLKQDGILYCSIPNVYWCGRILRVLLHKPIDECYTSQEHINSWTIYETRHLLGYNGFRLQDYRYANSGSYRGAGRLFEILGLNNIFKALTNHQLFFSVKKMSHEPF
jgi:SAM-dependent methyltransferase